MSRRRWLWLSSIAVLAVLVAYCDYHRAAFGQAWTDDNDAPGGHTGCDTRDDILNRDLVDKTYVFTKHCPDAVETGTLHDPYTNATINFHGGAKVGEAVQIDHIVSAALTICGLICTGQCVDGMPLTVLEVRS